MNGLTLEIKEPEKLTKIVSYTGILPQVLYYAETNASNDTNIGVYVKIDDLSPELKNMIKEECACNGAFDKIRDKISKFLMFSL